MQRTKNYYIYFCIIKKGTFQVKYFYILRMCCFFVPLHIEAVKVIIQSRFPTTYKQKERRAKLLKTKNKKKNYRLASTEKSLSFTPVCFVKPRLVQQKSLNLYTA